MDIFQALLVSHAAQRELVARLRASYHDPGARDRAFQELKAELMAHETAEERCFFVPLFGHDETVDESRHAIAEHHAMDEMVEHLEGLDGDSRAWRACAEQLCEKVEHHLDEEEREFFPAARDVLPATEQRQLALDYEAEFTTMRVKAEAKS